MSKELDAHRGHEPGRDALPRVQADQQVGPTNFIESLGRRNERDCCSIARSVDGYRNGKLAFAADHF
jgi:hypothetical protein